MEEFLLLRERLVRLVLGVERADLLLKDVEFL